MCTIYDDDDFFESYAQMARSRDGLTAAGEWHQLQPMIPVLADKHVLDLGCGYGWHCKYAAEHGAASVLGIDLSEKMLKEAKNRNDNTLIAYQKCGILDYSYPFETYDLVISNLALHYIADLGAVYRKVYRTLKPGGVFLINIEHPTFTAGINQTFLTDKEGRRICWPVDDYYCPGPRQTVFLGKAVTKQHHTLTQVLGGLLEAGFALKDVQEAMPSEEMMNFPGMADEMRRPMMLLVKAVKETR